MSDEIMVSVVCPTYGHEKYIRKALDSILMQKVNFNMEVLVGEDCSPDNSREILKEYEKKYPGFFTVFYREKNMGPKKNIMDLLKGTKGKYFIILELDDFWVDENKLQKQVDFLETHNDYFAVCHKFIVVDENDKDTGKNLFFFDVKGNHYRKSDFLKEILPCQTATILARNYYKDCYFDKSIIEDDTLYPLDRLNAFLLTCCGDVYIMPEIMSAYRYIVTSGTSFSASTTTRSVIDDMNMYVHLYGGILEYAKEHMDKSAVCIAEKLYFLYLVRREQVSGNSWIRYWLGLLKKDRNEIKNKFKVFCYIPIQKLRHLKL